MARKAAPHKDRGSVAVVGSRSNCKDYLPLLNQGEKNDKYTYLEEAQFCAGHGFEVVILDCGLDPDAGVESLREMKRSRPDVPVIFVTAAGSEEQVVKCFRAGARDYFRKPFSILELKKTVDELLGLKRSAVEKRSALARNRSDRESELRPPVGEVPERVLRVVRYMERNFCSEIYLDHLAENACLSKYHFCRTFKSHMGMSPMQYLVLLRVERAKLLLQHADLTVSMVALQSGFSDTSDFIRHFKKAIGLTPYAYKSSQ